MIKLTLFNQFYIKLDTRYEILSAVADNFSDFKPGYEWAPKFKCGFWDGKVSVFNKKDRTLGFGLLTELLKFLKTNFSDEEIIVDEELKAKFIGEENVKFKWDLKWKPHDYQEDTIRKMIKYKSCIAVVGTGGGKSLISSYVFRNLYNNKIIKKPLIIVPTIDLVHQFKADMIDYGFKESEIGIVWGGDKQFDKKYTISTWQSMGGTNDKAKKPKVKKKKEDVDLFEGKYELFDSIIIDECHKVGDWNKLQQLLTKCNKAEWRWGLTGTLHDDDITFLSNWNVKSFLGPVVVNYPTKYLQENGHLAQSLIEMINIHYKKGEFGVKNKKENTLKMDRDTVFSNPKRLNIIKNIINEVKDGPVVVLVDRVDLQGKILKDYLIETGEFEENQILFVHGGIKSKKRQEWYERCKSGDRIVLIAMAQIFQAGINIPHLFDIIFASSGESKIKFLQAIGRVLRKMGDKVAKIRDIVDIIMEDKYGKYSGKADVRIKYYLQQGHEVIETNL